MNLFRTKNQENRKNPNSESYTEVERLLRSSAHKVTDARDEFKSALLRELKTEAFANDHSLSRPMSNMRFVFLPALAGVLLLAVLGFAAYRYGNFSGTNTPKEIVVQQPPTLEEAEGLFELVALNETANGVHPSTTFELRTKAQTTVEKIKENLTFKPKVAFAVEKTSDTTYRITPEKNLDAGDMLTARLNVTFQTDSGGTQARAYSWAYQVQEEFQVVSTLPRNTSTNVPVDTGVEITFSHAGFEGAEENFSITPTVKGRFETHRKTFVFVPEEKLKTTTLYTVRMKKDVHLPKTGETLKEDLVFQFETAEYTDAYSYDSTPGITSFSQKTNETSTSEIPSFILNGISLNQIKETEFSIYAFPDRDAYEKAFNDFNALPYWARSRDQWTTDTSKLILHSKTTVPLQDLGNQWQYVVTAPSTLEKGYYLVQTQGRNSLNPQALLAVTDITGYVTLSETQLVVWTHDSRSQTPLADARVLLNGAELGRTNTDGVLAVDSPASLLANVKTNLDPLVIEKGSDVLYLPLIGNAQGFTDYRYSRKNRVQNYWSYLYADQPIYRPNDTVNFWGVLDPRDTRDLSEVTVTLYAGYSWQEGQRPIVTRQTVVPGAFGAFEGAITLPNVTPNMYALALEISGESVTETSVDVQTFVKPAYTLDVTPAVRGVMNGDSLTHTLTAQFFNGSPVQGVEISRGDSKTTTNEQGVATFSSAYRVYREGQDSYEYLNFNPTRSEEGDIWTQTIVRVFPSSEVIMVNSKSDGTTALLNGALSTLDLAGYNDGKYRTYEDPIGNPVPNDTVHLNAKRIWHTETQTGTRYDFIQKKAVPLYSYDRHEEPAFQADVKTDANGEFSYTFTMQEKSSYEINVNSRDGENRLVERTTYVYPSRSYGFDSTGYFELRLDDKAGAQFTGENRNEFSLGDEVKATFLKDDVALPKSKTPTFLYLTTQNGIRDVQPSTEPTVGFTFAEKDIPNVILQGIWFDGRTYWTSDSQGGTFHSGSVVSFKEKDRELTVTVTPDKTDYQPGDTVNLAIETKRPDGKATEAVVNVSLVDEAVFALQERDVAFLTSLYRDVESGIYAAYGSHRYPSGFNGAEGGGGGGGLRQKFFDKALFQTVTTDRSGKASITFTLPDNLTSWRATAHGLDEEYYAGNSISKIPVTLPFFVDAVLAGDYVEGDDVVMTVRTFGTALDDTSPVEIRVSSETLPFDAVTKSVTGFDAVDIPLGKMPLGNHSVRIEAKSGELADAVLRKLTVAPSRLAIPMSDVETVSVGWTPDVQAERNTDVMFTDANSGKYYSRLVEHLYTFGDRLDQRLARIIAATLVNTYFDGTEPVEELDAEQYQLSDYGKTRGGLALFPYSDHDLALSAYAAASMQGEEFDPVALAEYFSQTLSDITRTTHEHAQSLYGLAAIHEPVLIEIRAMLESEKITDVDRLYLALGLAELGDDSGATAIFDTLETSYGKTMDTYAVLELGETRDEQLENTLLFAELAAMLQRPNADAYYTYARDNATVDALLVLAELNYLDARLATLPKDPVKLRYELQGVEEELVLENGEVGEVVLTRDTQDTFRVTSLEGSAMAVVTSTRKATPEDVNLDSSLSVTRTYEKTTINAGDLVKVTMKVNIKESAPDGLYQISDFIPSGLTIVAQPYRRNMYISDPNVRYPYTIDGQRISFLYHKNEKNDTFTYYVRVVNKGAYLAERPVIQSVSAPSVRMGGEEAKITVK